MIAVKPILEVTDLTVEYASGQGSVRAVDHVSLDLAAREFLAIVGESGCGKSTLLYAIARLLSPPAEIVGGTIHFAGHELVSSSEEELRHLRWREYSIVMQSAMNALNPVLTIGAQLEDALRAHEVISTSEVRRRSAVAMRLVGIDPVHLGSYPHQLSGGMRQRAMIAMALLFEPQLVIMDEPTSALDVVAQRSLMLEVKELQRKIGFALIFVTHDMSLVSHFSDRLAVMYAGQIVEIGPTQALFDAPKHPYTQGLMQSFPSIRGPRVMLTGIPGFPPDLRHPPTGCRFHPRCPKVMARCRTVDPPVFEQGADRVRCLLYDNGH